MSRVKMSLAQAVALGIDHGSRSSQAVVKDRKAEQEAFRKLFLLQCRAHGVPVPAPEYRFDKVRKWMFDFCWIRTSLALEVQGGIWTGGRHVRGAALLKEHEKLNEAACRGFRILYCTPKDVKTGAIFPLIRRALG